MFPPTMAPKWPILVSQCGMDHQKPTILLIFGTLCLGVCGGQSKLLFWKLVLTIKMSISQDFKTTFKYNLTCIFLSLRAKLKNTLQCETPCTYILMKSNWIKNSSTVQLSQSCFDIFAKKMCRIVRKMQVYLTLAQTGSSAKVKWWADNYLVTFCCDTPCALTSFWGTCLLDHSMFRPI